MAENNDKSETFFRDYASSGNLEEVYKRHGRIDLVPLPSDVPEDPLNWSSFRKNTLLALVAFHACLGPFSAACAIPSFELFAAEFAVSLTKASYITAVPIVFLGTFPFLWAPVSSRIGRRPVYLASMLISAAMQLASAYCTTYGSLVTCRVLVAIFICPPQSIGASTVSEVFFVHEKGQKMGVWALLVSLGPTIAPLIMGPLVYHTGKWQWTFFLLAIMNFAHFILYLFFCPETLFNRPIRSNELQSATAQSREPVSIATKWYIPYTSFHMHSKEPWSKLPLDVISPLQYIIKPTIVLPSFANAITFTYTNVLLTVQIPALLGQKYQLNIQQIGLQFIAPFLGALLGEPFAGLGSDKWMQYRVRRANGKREVEWRLPFAIPGFLISIIGLMVLGIRLQNTPPGVWNITPDIGSAIALFGQQIVTTVCTTYAIESQPEHTGQAAILVTLIRQTYAFTGPFYFTNQFNAMGIVHACGLLSGLIAIAMCLILACIMFGESWRTKLEAGNSEHIFQNQSEEEKID
ncbi:MFS multidrug transporter [Lentinula aciculospora]|uniref:MFS multidrug transporter n=1 Tax=Lentinula aciculospora TaxID=153920 RepID=A0A9W9AW07_9AGAR|nr:MFS multidrug transporter [Lentinula aciculospora]